MAWTPQSDYASVNAKLTADPRYKAALTAYSQALAANTTTITGGRQDDTGVAEAAQAAKTEAAVAFAKVAHQILQEQGITDFDRLGFSPDSGVVAYEPPDHSLRNILIPMAAIATAGILTGAFAGPEAGGLGVGAVEGGAYGVPTSAVAGLGTGAMAAVPVAGAAVPTASLAALGGGAAPAAASAETGTGAAIVDAAAGNGSWDAAGNFIGPSTVSSVGTGGGTGIGSTISKIASSSWFPSIVQAATGIYGAKVQADASKEAIDAQSQATKDALDFAKSQAALEQKNFAPYLAAGTGALSKLSFGLGIGSPGDYDPTGNPVTPPGGSPGSITPAGDPQVSPKSPAAQFIANTRTQPVWMISPTGERGQVPANMVQQALEKGAKLEPGQGLEGGSVPRTGSLALIGRTPPTGAETIGTATARV